MSKGKAKEWEEMSPEKRKETIEKLNRMRENMDRSVQALAASRGLKKFWEDIRKDPVRYKAYIEQRKQTLKKDK